MVLLFIFLPISPRWNAWWKRMRTVHATAWPQRAEIRLQCVDLQNHSSSVLPIDTFLFAAPATLAATLVAALFGLLIGSFLNVVVYRLPLMGQRELENYIAHEAGQPLPHQDRFNLMVPRSSCP